MCKVSIQEIRTANSALKDFKFTDCNERKKSSGLLIEINGDTLFVTERKLNSIFEMASDSVFNRNSK